MDSKYIAEWLYSDVWDWLTRKLAFPKCLDVYKEVKKVVVGAVAFEFLTT